MVHAAETFALAVLENLVHWQTSTLPRDLVCVRATIPSEVAQEWTDGVDPASLTSDDYRATRRVGDDWYRRRETAVLWVPSVVSPYEANVLFNQRHADFSRIVVEEPVTIHLDARLPRRASRRVVAPEEPSP